MSRSKKKAKEDRVPVTVIRVNAGDIVEPDFYNSMRTTMYPVIKPCVVKDVKHDGIDWTLFLVDTTAGERWLNARFFNFKA